MYIYVKAVIHNSELDNESKTDETSCEKKTKIFTLVPGMGQIRKWNILGLPELTATCDQAALF